MRFLIAVSAFPMSQLLYFLQLLLLHFFGDKLLVLKIDLSPADFPLLMESIGLFLMFPHHIFSLDNESLTDLFSRISMSLRFLFLISCWTSLIFSLAF